MARQEQRLIDGLRGAVEAVRDLAKRERPELKQEADGTIKPLSEVERRAPWEAQPPSSTPATGS